MNKHKFNIFPEMNDEEFTRLKNDLSVNGFDSDLPITIYQGDILDGWNRYRACKELNIDPEYIEFEGSDIEAINFVMRTNKRRNLTSWQWACVAVKNEEIIEMIKAEAKKRQGKRNDLNITQLIAEREEAINILENFPESKTSSETIAEMFNTNEKYIREAEKLKKEKPEVYENSFEGKITYPEIKKEEKKEQVNNRIEELKQKEVLPTTGKYDVIVIDPPWQMEKIEREVAPEQVGFDYPTMSIDDIKKFKLPAENDCHVFMWITQKHLPFGFEIFKEWRAKYVCTFVWHKNGGFQPFGLPQYNCEFILYGRIGTPIFTDFKQFFTCFNADRKGHSKKPDEFYELLRRVTSGKRIDIFNRRDIEGFDKWGNEAENN